MSKLINLVGKKFGKLTVVSQSERDKKDRLLMWNCVCECGNHKIVKGKYLKSGRVTSCGCAHRGNFKKDITGQKFGRLYVERFAYIKNERAYWHCKCDCGNEVDVLGKLLRSGHTESCGCLQKETFSKITKTHGLSKTKLYKKWLAMKARCTNPKNDHAKYYIDKGIKVCDEWQNFETFKEWSYANGYNDNLSIERIDINKGYCPENCKWIILAEQSLNKSTTHWIAYKGRKMPISKWCEELGYPRWVLQERITKKHWDIEKALTTPYIRVKKK